MKTLTLLLATLVPLTVLAADSEFDYLLGDIEQWEEALDAAELDLDFENREHDTTTASDTLVPIDEGDRRGERTILDGLELDGNLTLEIDGELTELTDVPNDSWFAPYVRTSIEQGSFSGYRDADGNLLGLFGPGDDVTIEQVAKIALEASGLNLVQCRGNTPKNKAALLSWSRGYIACAEGFHFAVYSDGGAQLQRPATRTEVVITVIQALNVQFDRALGTVFTDVGSSTEFAGAIERMASDGIVSGYTTSTGVLTGEFGPKDTVTRAQMAKIISLAVDVYGTRN